MKMIVNRYPYIISWSQKLFPGNRQFWLFLDFVNQEIKTGLKPARIGITGILRLRLET
jgi:hypothetical protein